jgi:Ca2+-binding RTX toxin-like protein
MAFETYGEPGIRGVIVHSGSSYGTGSSNNRFGAVDPTDIGYNPATGGYYMVDSEVDESPFFATNNMFKLNGDADLLAGINLTGFTKEPTGIAVWNDPTGSTLLFITDDNRQRVYVVDAANPTVTLRSFSTTNFGCQDPEDISINPVNGNLFVLSENDRRIYEVTQKGVLVATIQMPSWFAPIPDPNAEDSGAEGLAYDAERDLFYVSGGFSEDIFVLNRAGEIVETITVLSEDQYHNANGLRVYAKGLELGPSSDGSGMLSLWVTDYGLDQTDDGRLFEIMLDRVAPVPPEPPKSVTGTTGNDLLEALTDDAWIVNGLAGNDTIQTQAGNDLITGGAGNDNIRSGAGDDVIRFSGTAEGFDNIDGGAGNDRIEAGKNGTKIGLANVADIETISANGFATVTIFGSAGSDLLDFSNTTLIGITAIKSGAGNDFVYGSVGNDVIQGGAGIDTLRGNGGADTFDYDLIAQSRPAARDKILDFETGVDKIDLIGIDANTAASGNQAFGFLGGSAFTKHAGELRIDTNDPSKTVILGDTNGDGVADFAIELVGSHQLSTSDFFL